MLEPTNYETAYSTKYPTRPSDGRVLCQNQHAALHGEFSADLQPFCLRPINYKTMSQHTYTFYIMHRDFIIGKL